jgi:hypothetical protein
VMLPDRVTLAHNLGAALAAPESAQRVNDLRAVLTTEAVALESDEQRLMRNVSERVDIASGTASRLVPLARSVHALLDAASSNDMVRLLLELVAERERLVGILLTHVKGTTTQTSFQSFVAEQRWPESVRRRIASLSLRDIEDLMNALNEGDIARLEGLIVA